MKKKFLIITLILAFIYSIGGIYYYFFHDDEPKKIKNISEIKDYNYQLKSSATTLLKKEFNILKEILNTETINEENYASSIAKLFIIDLYTLSNKINKYEVGGSDYIFPSAVDNYKLNVTNTIYKYLENNSDGKRNQELPEVKSIDIENIELIEVKIEDSVYSGYKINLKWDYIIDLEYDNFGEIILIKDNNKYYVTEKK